MSLKIASACIYTIVHSKTLDDLASKGGSHHLSEKKSWITGKKLLKEAQAKGETMFIVFTPAERCYEVIYFAELQNVVTFPDKTTTFFFKNMRKTEEPRPLKEELVVLETGETIHPKHIIANPSVVL